ncbi:MAG: hypothetical protein GY943_10360 [Chloroflexi bacterium]|nr:hypothetical protein [Chloroflexota bacterium]
MSECAKCSYSIPAGEENWVRQKSKNRRVALCKSCMIELKQRKKAAKPTPTRITSTPNSSSTLDQLPLTTPLATTKKKSSSRVPIDAVLILLLLIMIAAPLMGAVVGFISQWIYLIVLFPAAMAIAGGFVVTMGIKWGKLRHLAVAAFLGILFGLVTYGSYRYTEYILVRNDARSMIMEEMVSELGQSDPEIADLVFQDFLYTETGSIGLWGFVKLEAIEGLELSRRRSVNSFNIGSTLTWVYWIAEILGIMIIAALAAIGTAGSPFCEEHDRWYANRKRVGGSEWSELEAMRGYLEANDIASLQSTLDDEVYVPGVAVYIDHCPGCESSPPQVVLKKTSRNSKGKFEERVVKEKFISPQDGELLLNFTSGLAA